MTTSTSIIEKHYDVDAETAILIQVAVKLRSSSSFQSLEEYETESKENVIRHALHAYGLTEEILNRMIKKLIIAC